MTDISILDAAGSGSSELVAADSDWNQILNSLGTGIEAPDATNGAFWTVALADTLLKHSPIRLLSVRRNARTEALLSFYRTVVGRGPLRTAQLRSTTSLYAGRCGVLARENATELIAELLQTLVQKETGWGVLVLRAVTNTPSYASVRSALASIGLRYDEIDRSRSPYFDLPSRWEDISARLPKSLRWRIRKGHKELEKLGNLCYEEMTRPDQVQSLLDAMYEVERRSWKEAASVSITSNEYQWQFYQAVIPLAAQHGVLSGHVLALGDRRIAFMLGLLGSDGAFLAVKSSFDEELANLSPGHVLKQFAISSVIARGAKVFDFMGVCDEHKMRWTQQTYETVTLTVYNRGWHGWLARARRRLAVLLSRKAPTGDLPTRQQSKSKAEPANAAQESVGSARAP